MIRILPGLLLGLALALPAAAQAAVRECTEADLKGVPVATSGSYSYPGDQPGAFDRAVARMMKSGDSKDGMLVGITGGTELGMPYDAFDAFGFGLKFIVGVNGRISCVKLVPARGSDVQPRWNWERWAWVQTVSSWRFKPFRLHGKRSAVVGQTDVWEYEVPREHIPMPAGDPRDVVMKLDGPFNYRIEVHGDGRMIYDSSSPDYVTGPLVYQVDPAEVAYFLHTVEEADFWSLRDVYPVKADASKKPGWRLEVTLGDRTKSLAVYDNRPASGIVPEARLLNYAFRYIVHWHMSPMDEVKQLKANGFDFRSAKGGVYLLQLMSSRGIPDDVVLAVLAEGAPQDATAVVDYDGEPVNLLEAAVRGGRTAIVRELIDTGALRTGGAVDQVKIDRAFRQAIISGNGEMIDLIAGYHPSMTYVSKDKPDTPISVLFLVSNFSGEDSAVTAAQRLLDLGADVNTRDGNGDTLLHLAAGWASRPLILYLLSRGADINAVNTAGETPMVSAQLEETVVLMLDLGADPRAGKAPEILRRAVDLGGWSDVEAWLRRHGYGDILQAKAEATP